jgi:hypothetical protein
MVELNFENSRGCFQNANNAGKPNARESAATQCQACAGNMLDSGGAGVRKSATKAKAKVKPITIEKSAAATLSKASPNSTTCLRTSFARIVSLGDRTPPG